MRKIFRRLVPRFMKDELKGYIQAVSRESLAADPPGVPAPARAPQDQALQERVVELEAALGQLECILRRETTSPPPPPKHLQVRVVGAYVPGFIESGFAICDDLNAVLRAVGKELKDFRRILDWGCGCGRTTRALKSLAPSVEVYGTDIDPEAIGWLKNNYSRFADFRVAPHLPPMPYEEGTFDLVFGISVFTHLPEDMQFQWLQELRRITTPGGYLIMTTSGENNYRNLPPELLASVERDGFLYVDGGYGQSINLPAFYQNAFHTPDYVQREWAKVFRVVEIQPARLQKHLDTILLQRRD